MSLLAKIFRVTQGNPDATAHTIVLSMICLFISSLAQGNHDTSEAEAVEKWLHEDSPDAVPQVGKTELLFLENPPKNKTPLSQNQITISDTSLSNGWVHIKQCYKGLDSVSETEIVYRYRNMRQLQIESHSNIGKAIADKNRVQLFDVQQDAALCINTEAQILYSKPDGRFVLRNGPFHRTFLDGYFPFQVILDVDFPERRLRYVGSSPEPQMGFSVEANHESVHINSWFAGTLHTEIYFVSK